MAWTLTEDAEEYAAAVGPLLGADPERHTIALTVIEGARTRARRPDPPERYAWFAEDDGTVTGAASHTRPYLLLVEAAPDHALGQLLETFLDGPDPPAGVNAPSALANQVAGLWAARTGQPAVLRHVTRLFRLDGLLEPDPVPAGAARRATPADVDLMLAWFDAFAAEVDVPLAADREQRLRQRVRQGAYWLWLDEGQQVAMAGCSPPAAGVVRIGPVYTPPGLRRHGYAAGVTHAACAAALDHGHRVVLFTDLANPTSNALYRRLGFRAVSDRAEFELGWLQGR